MKFCPACGAINDPLEDRCCVCNYCWTCGEEVCICDEDHFDDPCPCGCGNYNDGSPPEGQTERNPCVYDRAKP